MTIRAPILMVVIVSVYLFFVHLSRARGRDGNPGNLAIE